MSLILFICFSTNSSETGLKNNSLLQSFVIHLSLILQILRWQPFIGVESFPISFATFTKKNSTLLKGNNRPVSILPTISKNFERTIDEQLVTFFDLHFNIYLSAFRSGYSCQDNITGPRMDP
jgi:hypothetical protein